MEEALTAEQIECVVKYYHEHYKTLTFEEMLEKHLQIMDLSAIELIKNSNIDVRIFSMKEPENFLKVVQGSDIGTTMKRGK